MLQRISREGSPTRRLSSFVQLVRVVAACFLGGAWATGSHAGAIDEALKNFGNNLEQGRAKESSLQRPDVKSKPVFDPAAARARAAPGNPQDYVEHKVPVGTEVAIPGAASLERILTAPSINADAVVSCVSLARTGSSHGVELGRFVVDEYSTSEEDTARMKRISNERFKGSFTAVWARVHHVVLEANDPLGRNSTPGCRGWVRIDSMDLYSAGTGPYPSSRLHQWKASAPPVNATSGTPTTAMIHQGARLSLDLHGHSPICVLYKNDSVGVLDPNPGQNQLRINVVSARACRTNSVGYIDRRAIR
ncbi:MAG: hypothetical protein ABIF28_11690 [Pseudomonadota bacterium]